MFHHNRKVLWSEGVVMDILWPHVKCEGEKNESKEIGEAPWDVLQPQPWVVNWGENTSQCRVLFPFLSPQFPKIPPRDATEPWSRCRCTGARNDCFEGNCTSNIWLDESETWPRGSPRAHNELISTGGVKIEHRHWHIKKTNVFGYLNTGTVPSNWKPLLTQNTTVIFFMGGGTLSQLPEPWVV